MAEIALCSLAQVKLEGRINTNDSDDLIREQLIPDALARLNARTGREFMPHTTATHTFDVTSYLVVMENHDLRRAIRVTLHPEYEAIDLVPDVDYELDIDPLTGTAGRIRLAPHLNLMSRRARTYGRARLEVVGEWGCWSDLSEVPIDVNRAAILTVLSALEKPVTDLPGIDVMDPRPFAPARSGAGWDIPLDAYRKIARYDRNAIGVW